MNLAIKTGLSWCVTFCSTVIPHTFTNHYDGNTVLYLYVCTCSSVHPHDKFTTSMIPQQLSMFYEYSQVFVIRSVNCQLQRPHSHNMMITQNGNDCMSPVMWFQLGMIIPPYLDTNTRFRGVVKHLYSSTKSRLSVQSTAIHFEITWNLLIQSVVVCLILLWK